MNGLDSLHYRLLVLTIHLFSLANRELLADWVEYFEAEVESIKVVAIERALLVEIWLPSMLHVLTWPELKELELKALDASRLAIHTLSRAKWGRQTHAIVQLSDQRDQFDNLISLLDVFDPLYSNFLLIPLTIVLGTSCHVRLPDLDQTFFAMIKSDGILEEGHNWVLLPFCMTTKVSFLLRDLLAEPDSLSNAVLPIISLKHNSSD